MASLEGAAEPLRDLYASHVESQASFGQRQPQGRLLRDLAGRTTLFITSWDPLPAGWVVQQRARSHGRRGGAHVPRSVLGALRYLKVVGKARPTSYE